MVLNLDGILSLKFLFLIITFFTFFCLIFLLRDCLTISTSGNSGISHYIEYIFFFMQQYLQNKKGLVEGVFDKSIDKYDLMNDFMSLGVHRFWKKSLINMMNPSLDKI